MHQNEYLWSKGLRIILSKTLYYDNTSLFLCKNTFDVGYSKIFTFDLQFLSL